MAGPPKSRPTAPSYGGSKLKSTSSGSSSSSLHSAGSAAVLETSPISKTALYRLTYHLKDLPQLLVFEVETFSDVSQTPPKSSEEQIGWTSGDQKQWEYVESRKLRYEALKMLLAGPEFDLIRDTVAVNIGVSRYTDHLIVPIHDTIKPPDLQPMLKARNVPLILKKVVKVSRADGVKSVEHDMQCVIMDGRRCSENRLPDLYWKSLDIMICKRATLGDSSSKFGVDSEFLQPLADVLGHLSGINMSAVNLQSPPRDDYHAVLRKQLSLDSERKLLHVNFDVIAQFPRTTVEATLYHMFGRKLDEHIEDSLPVIKRFLMGLRVRCNYISPNDGAKMELLTSEAHDEQTPPPGRVFKIKEVKLPSDVNTFPVPGYPEGLSVHEYFNKVVLEGRKKPPLAEDSLKFPLVSDDKEHWYPLCMLLVDDHHAYTKAPHLIPQLKDKGRRLLEKGSEQLRGFGNDFFKSFADPQEHANGKEVKKFLDASLEDEDVDYLFINEVSHAYL